MRRPPAECAQCGKKTDDWEPADKKHVCRACYCGPYRPTEINWSSYASRAMEEVAAPAVDVHDKDLRDFDRAATKFLAKIKKDRSNGI
jgi:hypothetical protein